MIYDLDIGTATLVGDGNVRIRIVAEGRTFVFDASPSAAASLAGRIAEALAKLSELLPTDKSTSV